MIRPNGFALAGIVAALWAVLPALPALISGDLIGSPFTDLYPAAWGMDVVAEAWPQLPLTTERLGAPGSVGFYYSSPIHGWLGAPLTLSFGPAEAYNLMLLAARWATVFCTFGWLRAEGRGTTAALAGALLYGAAPFFHGYAAEGIVEGTDGWTLALWAWMLATKRPWVATGAFALCVLSSWYLGMVACGVAAALGFERRLAWSSMVGGLLLSMPAFWAFSHAFGGNSALPEEVRIAMSAPLSLATPFWNAPPNPFALNTFVGFAAILLAIPSVRAKPVLSALAVGCWILSTGRGPWWELPGLSLVRFPYRWHAGTLFALAALVAHAVDNKPWRMLGFLPFCEGLLFSPIRPMLPSAPSAISPSYELVMGPILLELPGPVALPPGVPNPSRIRAREILWAQTLHRAASPWTLDFNGISRDQNAAWLASFASWDPILGIEPLPLDLDGARNAGVTQIMLHRDAYGSRAVDLEFALVRGGAIPIADDTDTLLLAP